MQYKKIAEITELDMKICWMWQLTNITESAMRDGCISQVVKEELREKWLNFTNNWKGTLWACGGPVVQDQQR